MSKNLYIIDGHAQIYAAFFAPTGGNFNAPNGEPTKATYIFTTMLFKILRSRKPDMLVVAMDAPGETFRHKIYPQYKANRPPMPDEMPVQIARIKEILATMRIPVIQQAPYEADDIIGTLSRKAEKTGIDTYICSRDKDLEQLLDDHTFMYDPHKDVLTSIETLLAKKGITPRQVIDALALQGDTSDNIPGVPDVGPKTALQWLQKYQSLDNLLAHCDEIKGKRGDNLRANKEQLMLSRQLVTINCNVPLDINFDDYKRQVPNLEKLIALLDQLGFKRLLPQIYDSAIIGELVSNPNITKIISANITQHIKGKAIANGAGTNARNTNHINDVNKANGVNKASNANNTQMQGSLFALQDDNENNNNNHTVTENTSTNIVTPPNVNTPANHYKLIDTPELFEDFIKQLKGQYSFAIDTETTGVNPVWADMVGISISWQAGTGYYIPVKAPLGQRCLNADNVIGKLKPILTNNKYKKTGQNIKYDMIVLRKAAQQAHRQFGQQAGLQTVQHNNQQANQLTDKQAIYPTEVVLQGVDFDTMVASYLLFPQRNHHNMDSMALDYLGHETIKLHDLIGKGKKQITFDQVDTSIAFEYAAEDADITWQLRQYLEQYFTDDANSDIRKLFEQVEMPLVEVLAEMEYQGVALDVSCLKKLSTTISHRLNEMTEQIHSLAGEEFNIDSPKQLSVVLFEKLGLKSGRKTKTGNSTDQAVLEGLLNEHEIIPLLLEYRQLSKLKNTYVDKLPAMICPRTGRVHASFNQTITATGRLSSSDPNLQNIPIRTELGQEIRRAFVPGSTGNIILAADYSQIELRMLAHLSGDTALREAFIAGEDIHSYVASQVFDIPLEDVSKEQRSRAKAVNFGIIYGQTAFGLSKQLGIDRQQAQEFIDKYFARYNHIKQYMEQIITEATQSGYVCTMLGRKRYLPDLRSNNKQRKSIARRMAVNTVVQGSAADMIKIAMVNIYHRIKTEKLNLKMIMQVHDELVFELPQAQSKDYTAMIKREMETALPLDVPVIVDIGTGKNWLECK